MPGLVGKLDPKTGDVTEYRMPDPTVRDPHSLAIAPDGIVWFTAQQSNTVGRIDPKTGEVKLVQVPTPRSRPYGILINSKGVPTLCLFGTNKLATIDPKTMEITEYTLPNAASARAASRSPPTTPSGMRTTRAAPSGMRTSHALSRPLRSCDRRIQGMGVPERPAVGALWHRLYKGAIWYNKSFAKPNTIVRFDPQAETFQSWAIPGGGDIVRKMDATPDGNPVTANSLVNEVGLIEVK